MLWFALGVIAIAGLTLVFLHLWARHDPTDPFTEMSRPSPPRPLAPDDDEEFLRSLSRHHED